MDALPITKAELARQLGVSRTYVTLLCQGKKKPSREMADRLAKMGLTANLDAFGQRTHGPLAQLVEHLTFNQGVTGSRPVRPIKPLNSRLKSLKSAGIRADFLLLKSYFSMILQALLRDYP
jgi:transcriptional regulator with XRE-family HTH domain